MKYRGMHVGSAIGSSRWATILGMRSLKILRRQSEFVMFCAEPGGRFARKSEFVRFFDFRIVAAVRFHNPR